MDTTRPERERSCSWWLWVKWAKSSPIRETAMPRLETRVRSAAALLVRWTRPATTLGGSPSKSGLTEMSSKIEDTETSFCRVAADGGGSPAGWQGAETQP